MCESDQKLTCFLGYINLLELPKRGHTRKMKQWTLFYIIAFSYLISLLTFTTFHLGEKGPHGDKGSQGEKGMPGTCDAKVWRWSYTSCDNALTCSAHTKYGNFTFTGGSVAEWSARRTRNPAVPGSSPALVTCWICARSSQVQIIGHACK